MEREASLELLNATHSFPCRFTLKVIGSDSDAFLDRVLAAVRDDAKLDDEFPVSTRTTDSGKHIAITMEPLLESAEHVLEVYDRIGSVSGVVMTM